jgi:hypothetical protein
MWRLWGKVYSIGNFHRLMRSFHQDLAVGPFQTAFSGVLCWLSKPRPAVSDGLLRAGGGTFLIPCLSYRHFAKGVAVWPDLWHGTANRSRCCRSSVVEHSLGKGEVESPILSGSTISPFVKLRLASPPVSERCSSCGTCLCSRAPFPGTGPSMRIDLRRCRNQ